MSASIALKNREDLAHAEVPRADATAPRHGVDPSPGASWERALVATRVPVPRDAFRSAARSVGVEARIHRGQQSRRTIGVIAWTVLMAGALGVGTTAMSAVSQLGPSELALRVPQKPVPLALPAYAPLLVAPPTLDSLPAVVAHPALTVRGLVPILSLAPKRRVEIAVNGTATEAVPFDGQGRFSGAVLLEPGANTVTATLVEGATRLASVEASVSLDRSQPDVDLRAPRDQEIISGTSVTVRAVTGPRTTVSVNGHTVPVAPDGSFSDTLAARPGPLTLVVAARNEAGTVTERTITVIVRSPERQANDGTAR